MTGAAYQGWDNQRCAATSRERSAGDGIAAGTVTLQGPVSTVRHRERAREAYAWIYPWIDGWGEQIEPCTLSGANPSNGKQEAGDGLPP